MSIRRGLLNVGTGMVARGSNQLLMIVVTLVATRFLGPAEFGIFAIATALVTLTRNLLYSGPFEYLMKARSAEDCAAECLALNLVLVAVTCLALLTVVAAGPFLFGSTAVGNFLLLLFPTNLIGAFSAWLESQVLREGRLRAYYVLTTLVEVIASVAAVAMLLEGYGLTALIVQLYVRQAALAIGYLFIVRLPRRWRPRRDIYEEVRRWSMSRFGTTLLTFLSNYSGDIVLGAVLSPAAAGLYRASNRVVTAIADMFVQPVRTLALATLSRRFADGRAADSHWLQMFAGVAFMGWSALAVVALMADRIAPVVLGAQWAATAPIIAILCAARALSILNTVTSAMLVTYDRQRQVFYVQGVGAAASTLFAVALAPFGVVWATIGTTAAAVLTTVQLMMLIVRLGGVARADVRDAALIVGVPMVVTLAAALVGRFAGSLLFQGDLRLLITALLVCLCGWSASVLLLRGRIVRAVGALGGH